MKIVVLDGHTLNPGDLSWKEMKEELSTLLEPESNGLLQEVKFEVYARYAYLLLLFSAGEIHITEHGLELKMPDAQNGLNPQKNIPEARKF